MGVTDLWTVLSPVRERVPLSALAGLTIAVDLSMWVCEAQSVKGMAQSVKRPHLRNLFFRVTLLCRLGLRLVFVVEGDAPSLKAGTMAQRNEARFGPSARPRRCRTNRSQLKATLKECCELLSALGLPCLQAAGEGEALCAALDAAGLVHGCFTGDGDAFLYGARTVYRGLAVSEQDPHVERYCVDRIRTELGLDRDALIGLAVLLGCDYLPKGVYGVGKELALKLIHSLQGESLLNRFRAWRKGPSGARLADAGEAKVQRHGVPDAAAESAVRRKALQCPGFPHEDVIAEFRSRKDKLPLQLQWGRPNLQKVLDVVERKLEWPPHYTCQKLLLLLATYDLQELAAGHCSARRLQPVRIVKTCVRAGTPCFEMEWEKPGGFVSEAGRTTEPLLTVERRDLVLAALPPLVAQFHEALHRAQEEKQRTKAKGRKRDGVKAVALPAGPPADDGPPHGLGEQLTGLAHPHRPHRPHRPTPASGPTTNPRPAESDDFSVAASARPNAPASAGEVAATRTNAAVGIARDALDGNVLPTAARRADGARGQRRSETSPKPAARGHDGSGAAQTPDAPTRAKDDGGGGAACGVSSLHSLLEELHLSDVDWSSPLPPRAAGEPGLGGGRRAATEERRGNRRSPENAASDGSGDPDGGGSERRARGAPGGVTDEDRSGRRAAERRSSAAGVHAHTPSPTQLSLRDRILLRNFTQINRLVTSGKSPKPSQSSVEFIYSQKCEFPNGSQLQASPHPIADQNRSASASANELGSVKSIGTGLEKTQTPPETLRKTFKIQSAYDAKPGVGVDAAPNRSFLTGEGSRRANEAPIDLSDSELDELVAEKSKSLAGKVRSHSDSEVKRHRSKPCGGATTRHASDGSAGDRPRKGLQRLASSDEVSELEAVVEMTSYSVAKSTTQRLLSYSEKMPTGDAMHSVNFTSTARPAVRGGFPASRGAIGVSRDRHPSAGLCRAAMPASGVAEQCEQDNVAPGQVRGARAGHDRSLRLREDFSSQAETSEARGFLHAATGGHGEEAPSWAPSDRGGAAVSLRAEGDSSGVFNDFTENKIPADNSDKRGYLRRDNGVQWSSGSLVSALPDLLREYSSSCAEKTDLNANGSNKVNLCTRNSDISKKGHLGSKSTSRMGAPSTVVLGPRYANIKPMQAPGKWPAIKGNSARGIETTGRMRDGVVVVPAAAAHGQAGDYAGSERAQTRYREKRGESRGEARGEAQERRGARERATAIVVSDGSDTSLTESPRPLAQRVALRLRML